MAEKQEYILCAAIWYKDFPTSVFKPENISKGVVLCGHRHTDIIHQHVSLMQKRQAEMGKYIQGFLTNTNKFLNRAEAMKVAIAANQLLEGSKFKREGQELYSEDLY